MLNIPNSLTLFRIFLVPFLVVVLLTKFEGKEIWGVSIFLVAAATDFLDGYVARRKGQVTSLGILLDPIADKLLTSAAFISLAQAQREDVPAWMVVVIVGREFAMSDLRAVASAGGILIPASIWGKFKMGSQVIAISLLIIGEKIEDYTGARYVVVLGQIALWVVVLLAVISLLDYFSKARGVILGPVRDK